MVDTGGPLNKLNGKAGVSDPSRSVYVMKLIRNHNPQTPDELQRLIREHHEESCECGVSSGGTVEDFGQWLYEAQEEYWGEERFTPEECIQWEYDLFVMQSLKGVNLEQKAIDAIDVEGVSVITADASADNEYRVDLRAERDGELVAGIQVKPESYKRMRQSVKWRNRDANSDYDAPVHYLFYNYDTEQFTNLYEIENELSP